MEQRANVSCVVRVLCNHDACLELLLNIISFLCSLLSGNGFTNAEAIGTPITGSTQRQRTSK